MDFRAVCGTRGSLRTMHGGGSAPSCCAFTHRVAFEEGSGPRLARDGVSREVPCSALKGETVPDSPGLGTEPLPGALCSGTGSPAMGLCSP